MSCDAMAENCCKTITDWQTPKIMDLNSPHLIHSTRLRKQNRKPSTITALHKYNFIHLHLFIHWNDYSITLENFQISTSKRVAKVIWRKSHRINGNVGTQHNAPRVHKSFHPELDPDPFSCACAATLFLLAKVSERDRNVTVNELWMC